MCKKIFCVFIFAAASLYPQYNGKDFSAGLDFVYTTSARIYLYPNSADETLRNYSFPLSDIINPAFYFRCRLSDEIILGLNVEYMMHTASGKNLTVFSQDKTVTINVEDGLVLVPVELSVYYLLPFSTEDWKFLMGGGAAYYYGWQIRKFGDENVKSSETNFAYGIQVSISGEYLISNNLSLKGEMKFRDPQFSVRNTYTKKDVQYNGSLVTVPVDSFDSKINVDGVTFVFGIAYSF